jgi:hypothetical protein
VRCDLYLPRSYPLGRVKLYKLRRASWGMGGRFVSGRATSWGTEQTTKSYRMRKEKAESWQRVDWVEWCEAGYIQ